MSPPNEQLPQGTLLNNRYRILKAIGQGGMGMVYKAEHTRLQTIVAVKEIRNSETDSADFRMALQLCEQEAQMLVRLNHPNLPKVSDAFSEKDRFYLVMDYIEGETLEARLTRNQGKPLNILQVVIWALQLADVLYYLHTQKPAIIFRDLKPSNIMVRRDAQIFLIDFGIARRFHPGATKDTALLGSVGYSPPEQFGHGQTDERSDIYSFGVTFHQLLTGADPLSTPFQFTPAILLNREIPEALSLLIGKCVALEPPSRPTSMHEVAEELLAIRDQLMEDPDYQNRSIETPAITSGLGSGNILSKSGSTGSGNTGSGNIGASSGKVGSGSVKSGSGSVRSTDTASAPTENRNAPVAAIALAAIVVIAGGIFFFRPHTPTSSTNTKSGGRTITTGSGDIKTAPTPPLETHVAPPKITDPIPPEQKDSVLFSKTDYQGVIAESMQVLVAGEIHGQMGKPGLVAILFYDQSGTAMPANPNAPQFATPDGQLAVAYPLEITQDKQLFETALLMPLQHFPQNAFSAPVKFRVMVFADMKKMGESDMKDFTIVMPGVPNPEPTAPQPNTPNSPTSAAPDSTKQSTP
ncbi:MAG: protein kinase [Armatimonadetes bacterium]|nr:protein kinase [Armatimonadota bacterium]